MSKLFTAAVTAFVLVMPFERVASEPLPPIFVVGEKEQADLGACKLTYASAQTAIEAALRYNRVKLASQADWMIDRALRAYVNLNAFEITRASTGVGIGTCAISVDFAIDTATNVVNPVTGTTRFVTVQYCEDGFVATLDPLVAQERVNARLRQYVDQCVSKYESK